MTMNVFTIQCPQCEEVGRHWCNGTYTGWDAPGMVPEANVALARQQAKAEERERIAAWVETHSPWLVGLARAIAREDALPEPTPSGKEASQDE